MNEVCYKWGLLLMGSVVNGIYYEHVYHECALL